MEVYKSFFAPTLDYLDQHNILPSETAHTLVKKSFHLAESTSITLELFKKIMAFAGRRFTDERLRVNVGGLVLDNPLIVGAGWDKEGITVRSLYQLGFAAVTVGTVPELPQYGNPKKRQFILAPGAALNRLGFNSPGMEVVDHNLERYQGSGIPIGISLGKNKDVPLEDAPEAHARVVQKLYRHAAYFELNVSSPNTPNLRKLQDKLFLVDNVQAVQSAMEKNGGQKPLAIKVAPDLTLSAVDDVIEVATNNNVPIIIAANTTINSDIKAEYGSRWANEPGGLSGDDEDFRQMSNRIIYHIYRSAGQYIDIIGVGGVNNTPTAIEKILLGAKAVQIMTGLRGEGPTIAGKINRGLSYWLAINGATNITEIVGHRL